MRRFLKTAAAIGMAALFTTGCLLKETSETWYVNGAGEVLWVVTEKDVRSDARADADRRAEENEYWLAVQQQRHPIAAGLQEIGGTKVRTLVLRGEAPFTVQTDARFTGLDELGRRLLAAIGAIGAAVVTRDGPTWEWTLVMRDPSALTSVTEPSPNVNALITDMDSLRVVLSRGRFSAAEGFSLSSDGRVAELTWQDEPAGNRPEAPTMTLRLVWKLEE